MSQHFPVVIIGAGPAGLTAAYELVRQGVHPLLLEKADKVGGIARTETYKGYHFDIGGHRFFTKIGAIQRLWEEMMGDEFGLVPRLSHIYYRDRFFRYPLDAVDALTKLGPAEALRILLSYAQARFRPSRTEESYEEWMTNRFGRRLYDTFFRSYTEKVWGIPGNQIKAEWAVQRVQTLSLRRAITHALFGRDQAQSLIGEFHYPPCGPGMMWQRFQESVEGMGGQVWMGAEAVCLQLDGSRVAGVWVQQDGAVRQVTADHVISTMPLAQLIGRLDPAPSDGVLSAAGHLTYRAFVLVGLIVRRADMFPAQWIYIHHPDLKVGRVQNFKNWSPAMVPDPAMTGLGMEYFCTEGDAFWQLPDAVLIELASRELAALNLAEEGEIVDGVVFRQSAAYPVYDGAYRAPLQIIRSYLAGLSNLQTIGRSGLHRYNNQDHSMLTGMLAVRNWQGEAHNVWDVATEAKHFEERIASRSIRGTRRS